ncbi:MAG: Rrf2 family transcriptional regulator [Ilumatobacteraceae bacterium]
MRLEVTRRSELAVRSLVVLDAATERLKAPALAAALDATVAFIPQVMGPLVKAGWVQSDPGPAGGYTLDVSLDDVSVLDVVEAVDGKIDDGRCVVAARPCTAAAPCLMHLAWSNARTELIGALDGMSVAALRPAAE